MIRYPDLGIAVVPVLLPQTAGPSLTKWPIVACDQFTSQPEYWEEAGRIVGDAPSTLKIIFPEVYLGKADDTARIEAIHRHMRDYLDTGVLVEHEPSMIYVERRNVRGKLRKGLVFAVDLECYDFLPGAETLIRATEGTVLERIPPRVKIRDGAPLESPHVMLLIDDPENALFEKVTALCVNRPKLYEVELMLGGGRLTGFKIDDPAQIDLVASHLRNLAEPGKFNAKYGLIDKKTLLFAVGDGNHSLATAKAVWERIKERTSNPRDLVDHPARFALVEVVNVHDAGLEFEPIHRILFGVEPDAVFQRMQHFYEEMGAKFSYRYLEGKVEHGPDAHRIGFVTETGSGYLEVTPPPHTLEVGTLQLFLDDYIKNNPGVEVDYIHGDTVVQELGSRPGNIGFYLPPMPKGDLFKTVILNGALPRKTFSMGEAEEKRYYMECRCLLGS